MFRVRMYGVCEVCACEGRVCLGNGCVNDDGD